MGIRGYVGVDVDGTFTPDSELRNQRVIQATLNHFATAAGLQTRTIDWNFCCGHSEDNIFRILVDQGFSQLPNIVGKNPNHAADVFKEVCLEGFKEHEPDYTPREDIIPTLLTLQHFEVAAAICSNSEMERVGKCLTEGFKIANLGVEAAAVFPVIVKKDDFAPNGLLAKPEADPHWFAFSETSSLTGKIPKNKAMVLEDSPPGVMSANRFTRNPESVVQFRMGAADSPLAGHHHTSMTETHGVMCSFYDIPPHAFQAELEKQRNRTVVVPLHNAKT